MRLAFSSLLAALGLLAGSAALGKVGAQAGKLSTGSPSTDVRISLRRDVNPILVRNCAMCHQDSAAMGALSLLPHIAREMLVKVPSSQGEMIRVVPGHPERSYLIQKLEGSHVAAGGRGLPMPIGQAPLTKDELRIIRLWIAQGATDN